MYRSVSVSLAFQPLDPIRMTRHIVILTGMLLQTLNFELVQILFNNVKSSLTNDINDLLIQIENLTRQHNMNELPFGDSPYSRNITSHANRATTHDEGPKTKKRKLDDAKTSEQHKSVNMQKLQKAISLSQRIVEKHSKKKEQG